MHKPIAVLKPSSVSQRHIRAGHIPLGSGDCYPKSTPGLLPGARRQSFWKERSAHR